MCVTVKVFEGGLLCRVFGAAMGFLLVLHGRRWICRNSSGVVLTVRLLAHTLNATMLHSMQLTCWPSFMILWKPAAPQQLVRSY